MSILLSAFGVSKSSWKCLSLGYKRGTGPVGAFHSSDIPEFYGSGASPDFIGTDALGVFSNLPYY